MALTLMDDVLRGRLAAGLELLAQGRDYARQLGRSPWDFAVEIETLEQAGLSRNDLRWLVAAGYLHHAREVVVPGDLPRRFHPIGQLSFSRRTCFVLTDAAWDVKTDASAVAVPCSGGTPPPGTPSPFDSTAAPQSSPEPPPGTPRWDADYHQLRVGSQIVKEFKLPAADQVRVLAAFEEERWPERISNPLPVGQDTAAKARLEQTILGLNRNQRSRLVEFFPDESGRGVTWRLIWADKKS
ncbi:MAG: hypothetical protein AB7O38_31530 [Pirellulaceae bacterium]